MTIHIEIFCFRRGHAHGAIWLSNGTAIPICMPTEAYETAKGNGLFLRSDIEEDVFPDENGVLNTTDHFIQAPLGSKGEWRFEHEL